jgi:hypothetical protein
MIVDQVRYQERGMCSSRERFLGAIRRTTDHSVIEP